MDLSMTHDVTIAVFVFTMGKFFPITGFSMGFELDGPFAALLLLLFEFSVKLQIRDH